MDEAIPEEAMALNVAMKLTTSWNVFIIKNTKALRLLLCNASIQSHFDYECSAWYPNLAKKLKHKIEPTQNLNKCCIFAYSKIN